VLVNVFTLDKADEQTFLKVWQDDAAFMKRQPGFISAQLHRDRRKPHPSELCGLANDRRLPGRVHAP
jgi:heme-degrading monooxygenase HmoA